MKHRRWTLVASGLAIALLAPTVPAQADGARHWRLTPPGRQVAAELVADLAMSRGQLSISVRRGPNSVVGWSRLGIQTGDTDFSTGLSFTGIERREVHESYSTLVGKRRQ